ncbi:hypothetical protein, partial [Kitasatospora sp. LaBMicrA B282]|uniref:hypothetical protein n=1 Tax=Kitasatospora sp. LaBMicrA B282 TaxID=3420949 RepID=UPI003D10528C
RRSSDLAGAAGGGAAGGGAALPGSGAAVGAATETRFKVYCSHCREKVELGADEFRLALGRTKERTFYSFTCPACGAPVRKPAGEKIVAALTGAGVSTIRLLQAVEG